MSNIENKEKKPHWLKSRLPSAHIYSKIKSSLNDGCLNTICESGKCPNIGECWAAGTATFMILGNSCTRNCKFCAVDHSKPEPVSHDEAQKLAETVKKFNLKHCVITSVTRDDLPDKGANHWADCIKKTRLLNPNTTIEVLTPDFNANPELIKIVADANPNIFSHNIETVERLTPFIRSVAQYRRSLEVLSIAHSMGLNIKSGIMIGLGENITEIHDTISDIRKTGASIITIGQYMRPHYDNVAVSKYYTPDEFLEIKKYALSLGFRHVESGPLVRSSYHSIEAISNII
ncbi:MAG: lipoyl synthase [Bacteroidales bacterium]|nr:lipoyl synthase [Bacteroidales bacterium]